LLVAFAMSLALADNKEFIRKLTEIVDKNLSNEKFGVKELVKETGLSSFTVRHRLKEITWKNINQFINEIRLQRALEMLRQGNLTASEVAYQVGFNSPTYFSKSFHDHFGYPPGDVKRKAATEPEKSESLSVSPSASSLTKNQTGKEGKNQGKESQMSKTIRIVAVIFMIIMIPWLGYILFYENSTTRLFGYVQNGEKSIAVLPFVYLGENKDNMDLAEGVMEDILTNLSHVREFKVISRTSVEQFRENMVSMKEIAKRLGVNYVLEGSVQRYGDKVRVRVQFIDARNDQHLFSEFYDRSLSDIFVIQSDIAMRVAGELQATLSPKEIEQIKKVQTQVPEAYNHYLKGRYFWRLRTEEGLKKSQEYFKRALEADPNYALAYAGLADVYFIQAYRGWEPRIESYAKAKQAAMHALDLDKNLAEAHATLGGILTWSEWNWEKARQELIIATELNPNYASAHQFYSELLNVLGEFEKARDHINLALKLDPFSYVNNVMSGLYHYYAGEFDECLATCKMAQDIGLDYEDWPWMKFNIYFVQGKDSLAVESLMKVKTSDILQIKKVFWNSGLKGILNWLIESETRKEYPYLIRIAKWNALLGNNQEALNWLEKTVKMRLSPETLKTYFPDEISFINIDPEFVPLRTEPRFQKLLKRMGLEHYPPRPVVSTQSSK